MRGAVLQSAEIEAQPLLFAAGTADFLVEALLRFVASPAALHELLHERLVTAFLNALGKIRSNAVEHIQADQVCQPESASAGPAENGAGEGVGLFDREPLSQSQVAGREGQEGADAVGDEVWRVVRKDHLFAENAVGEGGKAGDKSSDRSRPPESTPQAACSAGG